MGRVPCHKELQLLGKVTGSEADVPGANTCVNRESQREHGHREWSQSVVTEAAEEENRVLERGRGIKCTGSLREQSNTTRESRVPVQKVTQVTCHSKARNRSASAFTVCSCKPELV